ncbi:MAG: hypothetical protein ATN36_08005 [Epulopiscium sp. Nele67-Bin005]|nr:MAG: hypothetical protein ATN36_08005 [Epulopiscium sp. Nele67-Bin005]
MNITQNQFEQFIKQLSYNIFNSVNIVRTVANSYLRSIGRIRDNARFEEVTLSEKYPDNLYYDQLHNIYLAINFYTGETPPHLMTSNAVNQILYYHTKQYGKFCFPNINEFKMPTIVPLVLNVNPTEKLHDYKINPQIKNSIYMSYHTFNINTYTINSSLGHTPHVLLASLLFTRTYEEFFAIIKMSLPLAPLAIQTQFYKALEDTGHQAIINKLRYDLAHNVKETKSNVNIHELKAAIKLTNIARKLLHTPNISAEEIAQKTGMTLFEIHLLKIGEGLSS